MTLRPIDNYYIQHNDDINSTLQYLRKHILSLDENISEAWKYQMPFFFYKKKRFCYLWIHKRLQQPYIGIVDGTLVDHPYLVRENRTKMKILLIDQTLDLPIKTINEILVQIINFHKKSLL